jgi:hypothetical protein
MHILLNVGVEVNSRGGSYSDALIVALAEGYIKII